MKAITMQQLNQIAGYVEAGEGSAVSFSQDDATKWWCVSIGREHHHAATLGEAFENALNSANEYQKNTYDINPPKGIEDCAVAVTGEKYINMLTDGSHSVINPYLHPVKHGVGPSEITLYDLSKL